MRRVVVVALLVVISTIFVIPGATLPRTTLQAQQMADQVFWLLATAVPELLACFTVPQQISRSSLAEILSSFSHSRPAAPAVLIC